MNAEEPPASSYQLIEINDKLEQTKTMLTGDRVAAVDARAAILASVAQTADAFAL